MQAQVTCVKWSQWHIKMEPVAHYGIRKNEKNIKILVIWTNGKEDIFEIKNLNKTLEVKQNN